MLLLCSFVKWKSILYKQAIRNLTQNNLNGKLLTQGDFTTGPTSKKADQPERSKAGQLSTVKVTTGPI